MLLRCCFQQQPKQTAPPVGGETLPLQQQVYPTPMLGHQGQVLLIGQGHLAGLLPTKELLRMDLSLYNKLEAKEEEWLEEVREHGIQDDFEAEEEYYTEEEWDDSGSE